MDCIGQTDARVRSGGAGDAVRIGKPSRRGNRACLADSEGRVFPELRVIWALGRRPAPLAMRPASRRGAILARGPKNSSLWENAVQPVINTRIGS